MLVPQTVEQSELERDRENARQMSSLPGQTYIGPKRPVPIKKRKVTE